MHTHIYKYIYKHTCIHIDRWIDRGERDQQIYLYFCIQHKHIHRERKEIRLYMCVYTCVCVSVCICVSRLCMLRGVRAILATYQQCANCFQILLSTNRNYRLLKKKINPGLRQSIWSIKS